MASASLIRARALLEYRRLARLQWLVAVGTFILTIVLAPHIERAVIVGIVLAVTAHLWREARIAVPSWVEGNTLHLRPSGVLYFASAPGLEAEVGDLLARHRDSERLVVHLDGLGRVDLSGALALRDLLFDVRRAGLAVEVVDIPPAAAKIIERVVLSRGDSGSP
jgi:sulfate permease, SulP family